jgi:hypothetical protein
MKGKATTLAPPQEAMETRKNKTKQKTRKKPGGNKSVSLTFVQGPSIVVCMILI